MIEEIRTMEDEFSIASVNGRFYNAPLQYNFNCKFDKLKSELQDVFLDKYIYDDMMYERFMDDIEENLKYPYLKEFISYKKILKYIDTDKTGFYGRSGGNFTIGISYCVDAFNDCAEEDMYYEEVKQEYKDIIKIHKFCESFKEFMFNWFNNYIMGELEFEIEQKQDEIENEQDFIKKCENKKSTINKTLITYNIKEDDMREILINLKKELDTKIFHAKSEIESHKNKIKELEEITKNV